MTQTQEQYVVDSNGTKTAVILTIEQYEQLLEDLHDLAVVAERRLEQPISLVV
ncbi:MAG: type II toxin-antitoxin system Phd/YefM family antitoxin [Leptolyngbyaceae cyanobacterium CAN_BIN12]|nr:type II toxin-antitoxin system Phd/YefM family antitoxin [Leptolyngbyaceae cyanobacterium CAN_BIN12]